MREGGRIGYVFGRGSPLVAIAGRPRFENMGAGAMDDIARRALMNVADDWLYRKQAGLSVALGTAVAICDGVSAAGRRALVFSGRVTQTARWLAASRANYECGLAMLVEIFAEARMRDAMSGGDGKRKVAREEWAAILPGLMVGPVKAPKGLWPDLSWLVSRGDEGAPVDEGGVGDHAAHSVYDGTDEANV